MASNVSEYDTTWEMAISLYENAKYEEAIPLFKSIVRISSLPRQRVIYQALGLAYTVLEKYDDASRSFLESNRVTRAGDILSIDMESEKPVRYIHIPKTGGTSLKAAISEYCEPLRHRWIEFEETPNDLHYPFDYPSNLRIHPSALTNKTVVGSVRHIFPMLISYYRECQRVMLSHLHPRLCNFARNNSFVKLILHIANDEQPWISSRYIYAPFFERSTGHFLVDWIVRTESMANDLKEMCAIKGLTYQEPGILNKNVQDDWGGYYTKTLIEFVMRTWSRECKMFGFLPDGTYSEAGLHGDVSHLKDQITYRWQDDILRFS